MFREINDEGGICKVMGDPDFMEYSTNKKIRCDLNYIVDFKFKTRKVDYSYSNGQNGNEKWFCYLID